MPDTPQSVLDTPNSAFDTLVPVLDTLGKVFDTPEAVLVRLAPVEVCPYIQRGAQYIHLT